MIISGGVNIYPQETENVLVTHPAVADVAVIGVPNEEMGEEVKAVVQPRRHGEAGPELEAGTHRVLPRAPREYKCPRSVDFDGRTAAPPDRQALQEARAREVLERAPHANRLIVRATLIRCRASLVTSRQVHFR